MAFLDENGVAQLWAAVKDRLAGAFDNVEFDIAEQAANLVSGDSIATAFGKLAKNYTSILTSISDLNTSLGNRISEVNTSLGNRISELNTDLTSKIDTKLNKSDVLANYTTTATGKALDASLGPAIKSKMDLADTLNNDLASIQYLADHVIAGTVTMSDSGTSRLLVRQCGHVVAIWGYIDGLSLTANTEKVVARISDVSLPADSVRLRGSVGNAAYVAGSDAYINIATNGNIAVNPSAAGNTVYFNATYIR